MSDESKDIKANDVIDYSLGVGSITLGPTGAVGANANISHINGITWSTSGTGSIGPSYVPMPMAPIYTGSGVGTSSPTFTYGTTTAPYVNITSPLVIDYNGSKIDVGQAITMLMDRLCIIMPSIELHDKYPALREAYEAYKSLEALCKTGEKDE